jgi:hypothetical protein
MKPGPKVEPFLDHATIKARTVSLDDLTLDMAKVLAGNGNVSKGLRLAVRFAFDCYQRDRFTPGMTSAVPAAPQISDGLPPAQYPAPRA